MENQNQIKLKHRISRIFRSSFRSCKSVSDVIERPPPPPSVTNIPLIELFSPKVQPFRRKKWSKVVETVDQNCSLAKDRIFLSKNVSNRRPVSPISPPNIKPLSEQRKRRQRKQRKKRPSSSYLNMDKYYEFLSSEEEEDDHSVEDDGTGRTVVFSSRSLSSDSSESLRKDNRVKNSLVVVKKSKDPYNDFRKSMVEMIVEKQIFAGRELENLVQTFLSLNSSHHHKVIIEVYTEIWETLFSNSS